VTIFVGAEISENGAPGESRTPDLLVRSLISLYGRLGTKTDMLLSCRDLGYRRRVQCQRNGAENSPKTLPIMTLA
jgi:hypothetical protein